VIKIYVNTNNNCEYRIKNKYKEIYASDERNSIGWLLQTKLCEFKRENEYQIAFYWSVRINKNKL
jgi:hypothetical protein